MNNKIFALQKFNRTFFAENFSDIYIQTLSSLYKLWSVGAVQWKESTHSETYAWYWLVNTCFVHFNVLCRVCLLSRLVFDPLSYITIPRFSSLVLLYIVNIVITLDISYEEQWSRQSMLYLYTVEGAWLCARGIAIDVRSDKFKSRRE